MSRRRREQRFWAEATSIDTERLMLDVPRILHGGYLMQVPLMDSGIGCKQFGYSEVLLQGMLSGELNAPQVRVLDWLRKKFLANSLPEGTRQQHADWVGMDIQAFGRVERALKQRGLINSTDGRTVAGKRVYSLAPALITDEHLLHLRVSDLPFSSFFMACQSMHLEPWKQDEYHGLMDRAWLARCIKSLTVSLTNGGYNWTQTYFALGLANFAPHDYPTAVLDAALTICDSGDRKSFGLTDVRKEILRDVGEHLRKHGDPDCPYTEGEQARVMEMYYRNGEKFTA